VVDLQKGLAEAVKHFWRVRSSQEEKQGATSGKKDAGSRAAVTGGKHGDGFIGLIADVVRDSGLTDAEIFIAPKTLPCYFRPAKDWDLIVKAGDDLLAVIEIKAHVGSFGNNFNNRVEEALGNATDFWSAYREATFQPSARPWLGYLMMLERHPNSIRPTAHRKLPFYPMRPEFQGLSYAQRYEIFCQRLVRERLYDATCFFMSSQERGLAGEYFEPSEELSFRNFAAILSARIGAFVKLKRE
jgi:hypothetical protein